MEKRYRILLATVVVTLLLMASVGSIQLYRGISGSYTDSDILGEWNLSVCNGYSYDGSLYRMTCSDDGADEFALDVTNYFDGTIKGTYACTPFSGVINSGSFEFTFFRSTEKCHVFGYMESRNEMHLGFVSTKDGEVASSMSVYNRDGSATKYDDNCKTITGDWKVNESVDNGSALKIVSLSVADQYFSVFRGDVIYESDKARIMAGFITPILMGPTKYGKLMDSDGNIWSAMSTRGQIRLMNCDSEFLMTKDGGFVQSYVSTNLGGRTVHDLAGDVLEIDSQDSYLITGTVTVSDTVYKLNGNYYSMSPVVLSVKLRTGSIEYTGIMSDRDGKITIDVIDLDEDTLALTFDKEGMP